MGMPWLGQLGLRHPVGLVRDTHLAFPRWPSVGSRDKGQGSCQLLITFWLFWSDCYRSHCLASWIITRDSKLISCKIDLQWTVVLGSR